MTARRYPAAITAAAMTITVDQAPAEWVPLSDAAARLGMSVDALRRRVRRGRVAAQKGDRPRGPVWLVDPTVLATIAAPAGATVVAPAMVDGHHDGGGVANGHHGDGGCVELELLARLDRMQAELLARTEAAAVWQARAELLAGQLADAQQRILALEAPQTAAVAPEPAPNGEAVPEPPMRPWWRRWFAS